MIRRVEHDPRLRAVIRATTPLHYDGGGDPAEDRGPHVRAGSAVVAVGGRLVVVQDDAGFLAVVDPASGTVTPVSLPVEDGVRQWDEGRRNKAMKPDLEAAVLIGDTLLAFGSGSTPARERVLRVRWGDGPAPEARWIAAPALYAGLRQAIAFSGSEMNIEACALRGDRLLLFNRGNGAPRGALRPVNASCELPLAALLASLDGRGPAPLPERIVQFELGSLGGAALGFTDATARGAAIIFSAAAERSPNSYDDGEVTGSAIGWLAGERGAWAPVEDAAGPFTGKVEGIAPAGDGRLWAVLDPDDPEHPSALCEIELLGPWSAREQGTGNRE